jgi:esterase/lipase superfamily enzyme
MKVTEHWWSDRMGQDLSLVRWGHYGVPVLLFPTAGGDAEEVERNQLVGRLAPMIDAGRIKVYSCDSAAGRAMAQKVGSSQWRMWLFNAYHQAVAEEIVPAIHADSNGPQPIVTAGASIGAFNAVAMVCRYPHLFSAAIGMSGTYAIEQFIDGPGTDDLYFSSPLRFVPGLEGDALETLRQRFILMASGTGAHEDVGESFAVAKVLGDKGIPNRVDDWGPGYVHDWPTWWEMLPRYLDDLVP